MSYIYSSRVECSWKILFPNYFIQWPELIVVRNHCRSAALRYACPSYRHQAVLSAARSRFLLMTCKLRCHRYTSEQRSQSLTTWMSRPLTQSQNNTTTKLACLETRRPPLTGSRTSTQHGRLGRRRPLLTESHTSTKLECLKTKRLLLTGSHTSTQH